MTFDILADRCLLFVDDDKAMLVELLKEAELEMTRKCNIYEQSATQVCNGATSYSLFENYKQMIFMQYNGTKIHPITEDEISYKSDGSIHTGTPTGYFIRNLNYHLNYAPPDGTIKISFYGTVDGTSGASPIIPLPYHRDLCNYAVAIASAKLNPSMHDKHWMLWNVSLKDITNQDADRELIHTIRREV